MTDILRSQWAEANELFSRFVIDNYVDWVNGRGDAPLQSHQLFKDQVAPLIMRQQSPLFMVLFDNLRLGPMACAGTDRAAFFPRGGARALLQHSPYGHQYARNAISPA
ncbi:MAG: hypothetical protein IPI07_19620 [Flavobacteriales bacterium]|nr:hypothetical protein [Flavobacteriales bacterium]